jgi:hypothetical protein
MLRAYCDGRDPVRRPLPRDKSKEAKEAIGALFL